MTTTPQSAGDQLPRECRLIEVRVGELRQLFNAIDPSPFRERDLDPRAEQFIVEWARELPKDKPWALVVHLDRAAGEQDEPVLLRVAIHEYFAQRELSTRRQLKELFRRGRLSLLIAVAFLIAAMFIGNAIENLLGEGYTASVAREGLLIIGWVAMWRPLEVFLYDWWPIRADANLLHRLSAIPLRIEYGTAGPAGAWRSDWPAKPAADRQPAR